MHKKLVFVVSIFAVLIIAFFGYQRMSVRTLRIYNSYTDPAHIGELARTAQLISSNLTTVSFAYVDEKSMTFLDALNLVKTGAIDGAITSLYYWGEQDPVLYLLSSAPFSYNEFQQHKLLNTPNGQKLYDQIGKRHNIVILPCCITGIQINGWWRTVPKTLSDLRGLNMRITGIGAEIFRRLGAITRQDIPIVKLRESFKTHQVDVVEWASPSDDLRQEFFKETPHAMVPGWHEPGSIVHLIINRDAWNRLNHKQHEDIARACEYSFVHMAALYPLLDGQAFVEFKKHGVQLHQWNKEFLDAFYTTFQDIVREYQQQDPLFAELYQEIALHRKIFNHYYQTQMKPLVQFLNKYVVPAYLQEHKDLS